MFRFTTNQTEELEVLGHVIISLGLVPPSSILEREVQVTLSTQDNTAIGM